MQYKADFMLFWVARNRHVEHLPRIELFEYQKDCFVKGSLPSVFQERFKTLTKKTSNLESLLSTFDSVVDYFQSSMSSDSGSKKKSKNNSSAGGASAKSHANTSSVTAAAAPTVSPTHNARHPTQPSESVQKKSVKKGEKVLCSSSSVIR